MRSNPKLLLKTPEQLEEEATQVARLLGALEPHERDAILEAVPCLTDPVQLSAGLLFLQQNFPNQVNWLAVGANRASRRTTLQQAPLDILCADPTKVVNVAETDLDAQPTYGEFTSAG